MRNHLPNNNCRGFTYIYVTKTERWVYKMTYLEETRQLKSADQCNHLRTSNTKPNNLLGGRIKDTF